MFQYLGCSRRDRLQKIFVSYVLVFLVILNEFLTEFKDGITYDTQQIIIVPWLADIAGYPAVIYCTDGYGAG